MLNVLGNLNYSVLHFENDSALAEAAAADWLPLLEQRSPDEPFLVALSGGRIARTFFGATVTEAREKRGLFANVHFFWADERCVPLDHPDSNFRLANEALFQPLAIPEANLHRLRGELEPNAAITLANEEIARWAPVNQSGMPVLDLVLLGMGEDGHVASLFPNASDEIWDCRSAFLRIDNSPKPPPQRLSLSFAAIVEAKEVWVLVSGAGKEFALRESLSPAGRTPLARVLKARSMTRIYAEIATS